LNERLRGRLRLIHSVAFLLCWAAALDDLQYRAHKAESPMKPA